MPNVKIEQVWKIYPNAKNVAPAVQDFNLAIEDGEFIVFVGPSGCGKSTTLRMIAGLESITRGSISIDGKVINNLPPKDRDIAMVFQNYALYPNLSNFENMAFGLRLRKVQKYKINEIVNRKANQLDVAHLLERLPKDVSGGQRQRIALGRAIVREPKVFLMDEPLSNLDAKMRVHMRVEISKLHRSLEATTIYVTHDQTEAMTMGNRIVVMNGGVIQQIGTPEEIYNFPVNRFVASFIGSPSMNFLEGRIIAEDGGLVFSTSHMHLKIPKSKETPALLKYAGYELVGAIRPEYMSAQEGRTASRTPYSFFAEVDFAELVGADRYVYLNAGQGLGESMIARVPARDKYSPNQAVTVSVDMDYFLFFDRNTGQRIV